MKNIVYTLLLFTIATHFFACKKTLKTTDMIGIFVSQNTNSVLGKTIEIKANNAATICNYSASCTDVTFTFTTSQISFSNGKIVRIYDKNKISFSEITKTLNTNYYDGNGDGFNDKDNSIPQYFTNTTEYLYLRK